MAESESVSGSRKRPSSAVAEGNGNEELRIEFLYTGQDKSDIPRNITHARVDPSVKKIGVEAFKDCNDLVEIELCEGIEIIEKSAFWCCSLKFILVPSSCKVIETNAFRFCKLELVELCEGVKKIDKGAFGCCCELKSITTPSSLRRIGSEAFSSCSNLEVVVLSEGLLWIKDTVFRETKIKSIRIPSSVKTIGKHVFIHCKHLIEVELCEGLQEIGGGAFWNSNNLKSIELPSTIKKMGGGVFSQCYEMEKVEICYGVEQIGTTAFHSCGFPCIKIPSSIKVIGGCAFKSCVHLLSVELGGCFTIEKLSYNRGECSFPGMKKRVFQNCSSLRNIAFPDTDTETLQCFDEGCHDLMKLFGTREGIMNALESRFDGLPLHKICYLQSHHSVDAVLEDVHEELNDQKSPNMSQDCLGMTPLHILACSTKQNLAIVQLIVKHQPRSLVTEDKWGCIPFLYAIWAGAPQDIVQFFIDSLTKSTFPQITLDWDRMIENLCRAGVPLNILQRLLDIQQASFQGQNVNWQKASREFTICALVRVCNFSSYSSTTPIEIWQREMGPFFEYWDAMLEAFTLSPEHQELTQGLHAILQRFFPDRTNAAWQAMCEEFIGPLRGWWVTEIPRLSLESFQFLIKCDIPKRLSSIGVTKWHTEITDLIDQIPSGKVRSYYTYWESHFHIIHSKLVYYEPECHFLSNASSLLELALWNAKINETYSEGITAHERVQCRVGCGADIVIPNVLPYLISEHGDLDDDVSTDADSSEPDY